MSLGGGCCLALEYRWKGMEAAGAYCLRARSQHGLLERAFLAKFKSTQHLDEKAMEQMKEDGEDAAGKLNKKAAKVIKYLLDDKGSINIQKFMICQRPLHSYLNLVVASERAVWVSRLSQCGKSRALVSGAQRQSTNSLSPRPQPAKTIKSR